MTAGVKEIKKWHPNTLVMGEKVAKFLAKPEKKGLNIDSKASSLYNPKLP